MCSGIFSKAGKISPRKYGIPTKSRPFSGGLTQTPVWRLNLKPLMVFFAPLFA
jgi:hypothetical protein